MIGYIWLEQLQSKLSQTGDTVVLKLVFITHVRHPLIGHSL